MSPSVTAIALRGEGEDLDACLGALRASRSTTRPAEVLFVGHGAAASAHGVERDGARWIARDARDAATAWNQGAAAAGGEVLLFLRADTVADPALVARHGSVHEHGERAIGLGVVESAPGARGLAAVRGIPDPIPSTPLLYECVGQTLSVRREAFSRGAGFTQGLSWGGEIDLVHRLREQGLHLRRVQGPAGWRARAASAAQVATERMRAGQGSVELYRRTPALLPDLELGRFHGDHAPGIRLRRAMLAIGGPPLPPGSGRLPVPGVWRERWLRFQYEYHFWRGARRALGADPLLRALLRPPVILMYHAIGHPGEQAGCYIVPIERFRRQMAWLVWRGYRVMGLEDLLDHRRRHEPPPARSVVITFDDGYADNHDLAVPVLARRGLRATFFLVSGRLGGRNMWDAAGELAGRPLLSWEQVRAMLNAGMEIGAHTRSHPVLPELPSDEAEREVAGAREELEQELGRRIRGFAYPYGRLDDATVAAVTRSGYEAACCSRSGVNDPAVPSFVLRRVEVRGTDSLARFALATHRGWTGGRRRRL